MINLKEIKTVISLLNTKNKQLTLINIEKDRIINKLMEKVDELENDLDYKKRTDGVKRLILKRKAS